MNPEGHDDAPQTGDNNSVKPTQPESQAPQGIFSSGDLAVHSENLDAIKPELSDENKSRIASAFAQTDATQKHDQLADQMAEQDAVSGDVIPAGSFGSNAAAVSASGDIRLPGKKKSKLPLVFAVLVLLAVIGGVAAWLVLGRKDGGSTQPVTAKEAFSAYEGYLKNGPENLRSNQERDDNDEYFLFGVTNSNIISESELSSYLKELTARYNTFSSMLGSMESLGGVNLDQYSRMLTLFVKSASLRELRQGLLDRYLDNGANSAYNYISEVVPKQPDSEEYYAMKKISGALEAYLNDELNLVELYQDIGCIDNHTINTACGDEEGYTNSAFMELRAEQAGEQEIIINYNEVLRPIFRTKTDELAKTMETGNE